MKSQNSQYIIAEYSLTVEDGHKLENIYKFNSLEEAEFFRKAKIEEYSSITDIFKKPYFSLPYSAKYEKDTSLKLQNMEVI